MRSIITLALVLARFSTVVGGQQPAPGAQQPPPRVSHAVRRTGEIVVDGKLDDVAWAAATPSGDFSQAYPAPGKPAADRTEFRVLYDDQALYVGVRMYDAHPDSIASGLGRRDATAATVYSDWVRLIIDSYHDRRTAFQFATTPRGMQKDSYFSNDNSEDLNWDAIWEVGTSIDASGWVAEYRIPLSQLRFGADGGGERVWGIQVQRDIARRNERDTWAPWKPDGSGFVSRFGDLVGLSGISPPGRLEIVPYASSTVTRAPGDAADPFFDATRIAPKVGGDLKYGLPHGLTLSATINPDFGQVEVDPAVVNLSAFEVSFPEKRPFFLEGGDVFSFGQIVRQNDYGGQYFLYSRRVGRRPQLGVPNDAQFADIPTQTTIAGAAKVTGKTGPWTVGILDAVTTKQQARILSADGSRLDVPVEPLSNYFAGRLRRDFRSGATTVGAMLEQTTRALGDSVFVQRLRSDATFGGVDFEHDIAKRSWVVSGFAAGSMVRGSARAIAATQRSSSRYFQRPDARYLTYDSTRTSLAGYITEAAVQKNGTVFGSIAVKASSPGVELNDLGFQSRTGYKALSTLVGRQSFTAGKHFQNWSAFVYQNDAWNYGDRPIFHGYAGRAGGTFNNFWNANIGGNYSPTFYDDQLLRGGPEGAQPASYSLNTNVSSDSRKSVALNLSAGYAHDIVGGYEDNASTSIDLRPSSNVHLSFGPNFSRLHDTEQYIRSLADPAATPTFGRRYVLGTLTQNTLSLDTRVDVTISPTLSFVMYAQPFVSAGRYTGIKEFLKPGKLDYAVYGRDRGTSDYDPATESFTIDADGASGPLAPFTVRQNFNVRSLRGNAVLRWDYRRGSSFYAVWQQERGDFQPLGDFTARRDLGAIFRTVPTNVFLIKATYWIGR